MLSQAGSSQGSTHEPLDVDAYQQRIRQYLSKYDANEPNLFTCLSLIVDGQELLFSAHDILSAAKQVTQAIETTAVATVHPTQIGTELDPYVLETIGQWLWASRRINHMPDGEKVYFSVSRYPSSFIATLALLDLMEIEANSPDTQVSYNLFNMLQDTRQRSTFVDGYRELFFANATAIANEVKGVPEFGIPSDEAIKLRRYKRNMTETRKVELINEYTKNRRVEYNVSGYHPMAHGNSYAEVKEINDANEFLRLTLPQQKAASLLIQWLVMSLNKQGFQATGKKIFFDDVLALQAATSLSETDKVQHILTYIYPLLELRMQNFDNHLSPASVPLTETLSALQGGFFTQASSSSPPAQVVTPGTESKTNPTFEARYPYEAEVYELYPRLSLMQGQWLVVIEDSDPNLWLCQSGKAVGYVPSNFLQLPSERKKCVSRGAGLFPSPKVAQQDLSIGTNLPIPLIFAPDEQSKSFGNHLEVIYKLSPRGDVSYTFCVVNRANLLEPQQEGLNAKMWALYQSQAMDIGSCKEIGGFIDELVINNKELADGLLQTLGLELGFAYGSLSLPEVHITPSILSQPHA